MTLPATGQITLSMLQTEFGGSNPINIDEYYKGGALVPNTATNAAVPTSGQISLDNFHGASSSTGTPPTFTCVVNPGSLYTSGTGSKTSAAATATASGGTVVGYSWARISGDSTISINSPSAASTTFFTTVASGNDKVATFRCTVTFVGGTASDTVDVEFDSGV